MWKIVLVLLLLGLVPLSLHSQQIRLEVDVIGQLKSANSGGLNCVAPDTLTLDAAGSITIPSGKSACFLVDTFAMAASDDLTSIVCTAGDRFLIRPVLGSRVVVVRKGAGVVIPADFTLNHTADQILLQCQSTNTVTETSRSSGG